MPHTQRGQRLSFRRNQGEQPCGDDLCARHQTDISTGVCDGEILLIRPECLPEPLGVGIRLVNIPLAENRIQKLLEPPETDLSVGMVFARGEGKVQEGLALAVGATLEPESYSYASTTLGAPGGPDAIQELPRLPSDGNVLLLTIRSRLADGTPASVTAIPRNGKTDGKDIVLDGTFVIAHAGVLTALVAGGTRTLVLSNPGAAPVIVDVLAGLDAV